MPSFSKITLFATGTLRRIPISKLSFRETTTVVISKTISGFLFEGRFSFKTGRFHADFVQF